MELKDVKRAMLLKSPICYESRDGVLHGYVVNGCTIKLDSSGRWYYTLDLLDKSGHSTVTVPLELAQIENQA